MCTTAGIALCLMSAVMFAPYAPRPSVSEIRLCHGPASGMADEAADGAADVGARTIGTVTMIGAVAANGIVMAAGTAAAGTMTGTGVAAGSPPGEARASPGRAECEPLMLWPVDDADVTASFDPPPEPWLAGHRGVDLVALPGAGLRAPEDGVIAFVGMVAGKSVVTVRHGSLTSTFEPARTGLTVGASVERGETFASVGGESDHCAGRCVHWGLRRADGGYVDPQARAAPTRIVLKPVTAS